MNASAVVIGASGRIGAATEAALIDEGAYGRVYGFARSRSGVDHLDILDEHSIAAAALRVAAGPAPSLVIVATGYRASAEASVADLDRDRMAEGFAVNAIGPALVAKHFLPLLEKSGTPVFAMLSARDASLTDNRLGGAYGYRASKAALNMLAKTLAIESTRSGQRAAIVAIDPGTGPDPERAALQLLDAIEGLGIRDSGKFLSWDGTEIAP